VSALKQFRQVWTFVWSSSEDSGFSGFPAGTFPIGTPLTIEGIGDQISRLSWTNAESVECAVDVPFQDGALVRTNATIQGPADPISCRSLNLQIVSSSDGLSRVLVAFLVTGVGAGMTGTAGTFIAQVGEPGTPPDDGDGRS
jgi:hypothetical protein